MEMLTGDDRGTNYCEGHLRRVLFHKVLGECFRKRVSVWPIPQKLRTKVLQKVLGHPLTHGHHVHGRQLLQDHSYLETLNGDFYILDEQPRVENRRYPVNYIPNTYFTFVSFLLNVSQLAVRVSRRNMYERYHVLESFCEFEHLIRGSEVHLDAATKRFRETHLK